MPRSTIKFRFADSVSAMSAFETLQELEYHPEWCGEHFLEIRIEVEGADLTSALEIAQAHGGRLCEEGHSSGHGHGVFPDQDSARIPVTDDET